MPMSCFKPPDQPRRVSKELEKKIAQWSKEYSNAIKLLLLGAGESGKTTIIKQMKILHISGFSESERQEKAFEIRLNVLIAIQELLDIMQVLQPPVALANPENKASAAFIKQLDRNDKNIPFNSEFYNHIDNLWNDNGIRKCFERSHEFPLIDSAKYFLNKLTVIKQDNYIPSDQDILHCRKRTTEIQKIEFKVKIPAQYGGGSQTFWMFDVGGQRGDRRKWIQVFAGVTAVLFLVASSHFDSPIREDNETNTLTESLKLFEKIWTSEFLRESGFILFLNKQDVLKEKVENGISIGTYFADYENFKVQKKDDGNPNDEYIRTRCFIREKFLEITRKPEKRDSFSKTFQTKPTKKRDCYAHFTTATDTKNIEHVFNDVHSMILMQILGETSLI